MAIGWVSAGIAVYGALTAKKGADLAADAQDELGALQLARGQEQHDFNFIAAAQIRSVGRLNARDEKRQGKLIASRATAVAAAGGSLMDVGHLIADIHGEGAYRAKLLMYEVKVSADKLEYEGIQAKKFGADQFSASTAAAEGTRIRALGNAINTGGQILMSAASSYNPAPATTPYYGPKTS